MALRTAEALAPGREPALATLARLRFRELESHREDIDEIDALASSPQLAQAAKTHLSAQLDWLHEHEGARSIHNTQARDRSPT